MPFKRVVRSTEAGDKNGAKDLRSVLTSKISGVLPKLRELQVRRRRGTKWVALSEELCGIEWSEGSTEDREVLAAEMAELLVSWAREDAGEKRCSYQFIGFAEALAGKDPGVLFELDHALAPEDDDDAPITRAGETTFMLKAGRELVEGVGKQYVALLKEVNGLVGANASNSKALGDALANSDGKRWDFESKKLDLQYAADLFGAEALLRRERSNNAHKTMREGITTLGPILEVLVELVADQPVNNPPPTEDEIKTVFSNHPTMLKIALEYIAENDPPKKKELAAAFTFEWASLDQNAQASIVLHAKKKLGSMRMAKLAAWVKRIVSENSDA